MIENYKHFKDIVLGNVVSIGIMRRMVKRIWKKGFMLI
jgi:hypothetical protein